MLAETSVEEPHNLPDMDMLEENTCIKCNGIGELLVCREIGCPIAVHEKCMSWKPTFDDNGDFCCPYCSYKRARSRALQLRKKAALAKKALVSFLATGVALGDNQHREEKDGETVERGQDQHKESRENESGEAGQDANEKGEDDEMADSYRHEENENIQGQEETSVGCPDEEDTAADRTFDTTEVGSPNKSSRLREDSMQLKQEARQSRKVASKTKTPDVGDVSGRKMHVNSKSRKGSNTRNVDLPRRSPRQQNKSAEESGRSHEKVSASRKLKYGEPVKRL